MNDIEIESALRRALRETDPPDGFAERVIAAAGERKMPAEPVSPALRRPLVFRRKQWSRFLAAAAAVGAILLGTWGYRTNERIEEGMRARHDLLVALEIASQKTNIARRAVVSGNAQAEESR